MIKESDLAGILQGVEASNAEVRSLNSGSQSIEFDVIGGLNVHHPLAHYTVICVDTRSDDRYSGSIFVESDATRREGLNLNDQFKNLSGNELSIYINKWVNGQ